MTEPSPVEALIDRVLEIGLSQQHIDSDFARATNAAGDLLEASATMGRLLADNERLRGALKPFALEIHPDHKDSEPFRSYFAAEDVRAALSAIGAPSVGGGDYQQRDRVRALEAALRPFARAADHADRMHKPATKPEHERYSAELWFIRAWKATCSDDFRAALSAITSEGGGWRDIASAPKTPGAVYLGWAPGWRTPDTIDWDETHSKWCIPFLRITEQPTHWQPLPSAPSPRSGEDESAPSEVKG